MKPVLYLVLFTLSLQAFAQNTISDKPNYPQDYFRNPLDIPIFLAGNFGECRPGHFHSGVDIKTLGEENQPVHAAADGYISRVKMDKGGFGHALYVIHPNGYTTLYAHLNKFAPAIQQYLEREQYAKKHWDIDVQLAPEQFPVKKGQQIAWSGNTGASTAPHLHFEIRNTQSEHPLNPELFGLPIIDKVPPAPKEVAFYYDDGYSFYESDEQFVSIEKKGDTYRPVALANADRSFYTLDKDTIFLQKGRTGIGINVDDYMDSSTNTIAFYTAKLYLDDSLQAQVTLDDISYDESRYINAYTDYRAKEQQHKWIQLLFQLPGNHLDGLYTYLNANKGRISLTDDRAHKVSIVITDDKNNQSKVVFYICANHSRFDRIVDHGYPGAPFVVNKPNAYNDSNVSFSLDARQLYDNVYFDFRKKAYPAGLSEKYQLGRSYIPVHHYFELKIKPGKAIPTELKSKVAMIYTDDKDEDGRAATQADNGWYQAKVRNFGTYWLALDTTPPVIKPMQKKGSNLSKAKAITFEVKDAMTSVKSYSGYLDGKWICFEQHSDLFFYNFDDHCPKGKHTLVFKAEDENGNTSSTTLNFTR